jgi:Flp pilus assembly protein TadG
VIVTLLNDDNGTATATAALTVPLLLCGIYLSLEIGRYAYAQGALMYSAEETARFASANAAVTADELRALASSHMKGIRRDKVQAINVSGVTGRVGQMSRVSVEIAYRHDLMVPFLWDGGITIYGGSTGES